MGRHINAEGLKLIKRWEGLVLFAYDDFDAPATRRRIQPGDEVRGTLTIGYGHTGNDVRPGMTITPAQAEAFLLADVRRFETAVARMVKVPLSDNQFAALVAFCLNIGEGQPGDPKRKGFVNTTLLRRLNAGDYDAVPRELMKFTLSKGKRMTGLVNRRSAEVGLWSKGSFVTGRTVAPEPDDVPPSRSGSVGTVAIATGAGACSTLIAGISNPWALAAFALILVAGGVGAWLLLTGRVTINRGASA